MNKKKCLLILPRNVFPKVGGYSINIANIARILCEEYETTIITISELPLCNEEKEFYELYAKEYYYFHFPKWRFYLNTLIGFFNQYPLQCSYYRFKKIEKKIIELSNDMDIIIGALIRTAPYFNKISKKCVQIIYMIDSIALNYERSIEKTSSFFWKIIYKIEYQRLMKYEKKIVEKSHTSIYVNLEESKYWSKYGNCIWMPTSVKPELFTYSKKEKKYEQSITFLGKMDYQPNIDAVLWYLKNVHLKITYQLQFIIIGASPTKEIQGLEKKYPNTIVTGFVEDPYIIINSSLAVIAPMQTGGGVQNKVLETMALGKINILTSLAADPIVGSENNKHFLIANTPEEYLQQIEKVIKNEDPILKNIGNNAREYIKNIFTYEMCKKRWIDTIENFFK